MRVIRERYQDVDLLPERSQESLVVCLEGHSQIAFVACGRSHVYRAALVMGTHDAVQMADRWHPTSLA